MGATSSGSGSEGKSSNRKTSSSTSKAPVTYNVGAMNLSYTRIREDRERHTVADASNSWDALLEARDASFVWNRSGEKREASLPVVKAYKVGTDGCSKNGQENRTQDSLLRSLPLAPTHEIEMADAGGKVTDGDKQGSRRKVAL